MKPITAAPLFAATDRVGLEIDTDNLNQRRHRNIEIDLKFDASFIARIARFFNPCVAPFLR
ncbi:MAG: hypothetical protein ACRD4Q_02425 [Candidatus Acidiferrales bacterium]